jgi:hypothetical protein
VRLRERLSSFERTKGGPEARAPRALARTSVVVRKNERRAGGPRSSWACANDRRRSNERRAGRRPALLVGLRGRSSSVERTKGGPEARAPRALARRSLRFACSRFQLGLRGCKTCDRYPVRRAGDVVEPARAEEADRVCFTPMFSTDPYFEIGVRLPPRFRC